jgi:hypothetical protein
MLTLPGSQREVHLTYCSAAETYYVTKQVPWAIRLPANLHWQGSRRRRAGFSQCNHYLPRTNNNIEQLPQLVR